MNRIAMAAVQVRQAGFQQAARNLNLSPVIIEKDFWVCWMLGLLFGHEEWRESLVFKGGTALSKVFGAIRRFSEDIDLSLAPAVLGIDEAEVEQASSRNKRGLQMKELESRCCVWVESQLQPALELIVRDVLGTRPDGKPWLEYECDAETHSPVLYFYYPCAFNDGAVYLRRSVKLEFGSLTDQRPTGKHTVRPWLADVLPADMKQMGCEVVALEVERAFWEKATILHSEHHRDLKTPMPIRYSRHYADLAALARSIHADKAVASVEIRERVVHWKNRFFARTWARYDLAKPGTFCLVPPAERMAELERDYEEMSVMFLDDPLKLSEIMSTLKALEDQINLGP